MDYETQLPLTLDTLPAEHALHIPEDGLTHSKAMEPRCRRLSAWLAVVVCVLGAAGLAYLAGLRASNVDNQTNWTHYLHNQTGAESLTHEERGASWWDNARRVVSLDCRPILQKVCVKDLLHTQDKTKDCSIFPSHLAVPRCNDSHSFCGVENVGVVTGRCAPKVRRIVHYEVKVEGYRNTSTVETEIHVECHCVPLHDHKGDNSTYDGGEGEGGSGDNS